MDPSEYFRKFREEWADLAADIDQPDHWLKIGEVIEHCERCGNVPQIATVRRGNDRNPGDRLARRHCAVRDVATGGELLGGGRASWQRKTRAPAGPPSDRAPRTRQLPAVLRRKTQPIR